jgi:hypothetical protein
MTQEFETANYERIGFKNLADLKAYGNLLGKSYTGDSFEDAHMAIFNESIDDKLKRTDRLFVTKLKYVNPEIYNFTVDIGQSDTSVKESTFIIPFQFKVKYATFQLTPILDTAGSHDPLFMNVRNYSITDNMITISIGTFRPAVSGNTAKENEIKGWGIEVKAHLQVSIFESEIPVLIITS